MSTQSNIMEKTPKVQHKYKRDASDSEDEDENKAVVVKTLKYESVSDGEEEESDGEKEGGDGKKEESDGEKEESDGENEESDGENEASDGENEKAKVCKKRYFKEEADAVDEEESEDEVNDDDDEEQEEVEDKAAEEPKYKETWKETVKREFSLKKAITQKKIQDEHDNIKVAKKQP